MMANDDSKDDDRRQPIRRPQVGESPHPHAGPAAEHQPHLRPRTAHPTSRTSSEQRSAANSRPSMREGAPHPRGATAKARPTFDFSNPRLILIIAAAIVALLIVIDVANCSGTGKSSMSTAQTSASSTVVAATKANLPASLDDTTATTLATLAQSDSRVAAIVSNAPAYAVDGDAVQTELLTLAANEPAAIDFVADFPSKYPQEQAASYDGTVEKGTVPCLYQWDERWGYTVYSNTTFAITGCCPTAFSMVYMGLTGNSDYSPAGMAAVAAEDGYESTYNGTDSSFLIDEATRFGLTCTTPTVEAPFLRECVGSGNIVICDLGPSDSLAGDHFVVVTKLNSNGTVTVNDPNSAVRSSTTWNIDDLIGQTVGLYAYTI